MAHPSGLLDLPQELLDRIYDNLETPSKTTTELVVNKRDIRSISEVSRHIRTSVISHIFRDVILHLRWRDGILVRPTLYDIRTNHPDLAQHVRAVWIKVTYDDHISSGIARSPKSFDLPSDSGQDWLTPAMNAPTDPELRQRVDTSVREVYLSRQARSDRPHIDVQTAPAEILLRLLFDEKAMEEQVEEQRARDWRHMQRHQEEDRRAYEAVHGLTVSPDDPQGENGIPPPFSIPRNYHWRLRTDAMAVMILSVPPTITHLSLEALSRHRSDREKHEIAGYVTAATIQIYGRQLQSLSLVAQAVPGMDHSTNYGRSRRPNRFGPTAEDFIVSPDLLGELSALKKLTLGWGLAICGIDGQSTQADQEKPAAMRWQDLTALETLVITDTHVCNDHVADYIHGFPALEEVTLHNVSLSHHDPRHVPSWMSAAISLRNSNPHLAFTLDHLSRGRYTVRNTLRHDGSTLPQGAVDFINGGIPIGAKIDVERHERLCVDFNANLSLWEVEDGERGRLAAEERKNGKLVDAAFMNRFGAF